jgi:hypothetical protein
VAGGGLPPAAQAAAAQAGDEGGKVLAQLLGRPGARRFAHQTGGSQEDAVDPRSGRGCGPGGDEGGTTWCVSSTQRSRSRPDSPFRTTSMVTRSIWAVVILRRACSLVTDATTMTPGVCSRAFVRTRRNTGSSSTISARTGLELSSRFDTKAPCCWEGLARRGAST